VLPRDYKGSELASGWFSTPLASAASFQTDRHAPPRSARTGSAALRAGAPLLALGLLVLALVR